MVSNINNALSEPLQSPSLADVVLDHAGLLVIIVDRQGCVVRMNSACEQISGYSFSEVKGRPFWAMLPAAQDDQRLQAVFTQFIQEKNFPCQYTIDWSPSKGLRSVVGAPWRLPPEQALPSGSAAINEPHHWLSWNFTAVLAANGTSDYLLGIGQDVTETYQLQQRKAEASLHQTEARYRTLVEQIPAVTYIAVMDQNLSSIYYSPQVEAMLGYTPEEMISRPDLWMQIIHPDDRECVYAEIARSTRAGRPFQAEYRLFRKDGRSVWVSDNAQFVRNEQNQVLYQQGIMFDITEAKQAEENTRRQAARQAALGEFSQILAEVGVDLNQVLDRTAIKVTELIGDGCLINLASEDGQLNETSIIFDLNPATRQMLQKLFTIDLLSLDYPGIGKVVQTGEPLLISQFDQKKAGLQVPENTRSALDQLELHSLAVVPLRAGGQIIGIVGVNRETPNRPYTLEDQSFLQQLADRAALAIANALLYARNLRQKEELEQRVAERTAELLQNEQTLRALLNAFPDSAMLIGLDGTLLDANQVLANRMGILTEQIIGHNMSELLPPELASSRQQMAIQAVTSRQPVEFEDTQAGSVIHNRIAPIFGPNGQVVSIALYAQDITARRHAEDELYHSRQMLRLVMDTIPQRVFWKDLDLRYIGCNLACAQDAGFDDPAGLIGKFDYDLPYRTDAEVFRAADREVIASGLPKLNFEEPQTKPDGTIMWVRVSKTPLRDASGQIIGVLGVYEDITAQRTMQIALRESEERFRAAFEQAAVGITHVSPQGRFMRVNRRFCEIIGYSEEELLRLTFPEITYAEDVTDNVKNARNMVEGQTHTYSAEKRYVRKDGSLVWVYVTSNLVHTEDGRPAYFVTVIEDISARKQAQALLEERTLDLARSNADLEQFAYIASHDLQEPLRMISSFTQLLDRRYRGKLDERADEFIQFIVEGSQRMQRLINDLLIYSRVGTRGRPFSIVSAENLLTQVIDNLQIAIEENGAQVTHDPLPEILVDETQLIQLLQNLIGNAIKFHAAEPPKVHLTAQHQGKDWVFAVRDNGIGIDAQHYERIFVLFQRLHLHEEYPGTGIGLAVCKKIIERHGGRIWVESAPGQGSTFFFSIPERQAENNETGRNLNGSRA